MGDGSYTMWNNWAKKRSGVPVFDNWLDKYEDLLKERKDSRVLDLGCGNGADTIIGKVIMQRGFLMKRM